MADQTTRILVVDDNPATRYTTTRVLNSVGWTILEAASGTEALAKAEQDVDLVVLDVNLPDFDGFEVCRRIRSQEQLKRLPVIHLSATFVQDVDRIHGLNAGADGYLTHPVEPPVLIATVRAFLRTRRAEQERERLLESERAARAEAERANRFKDDFLATLSHELRTPLQSMIGWSQLLKMGSLSKEEVAEGLEVIERNAQAQSRMIADLLDVSRVSSGKLRLEVQSMDLLATIESALSTIVPAAEAKGIQIKTLLDPAGSHVSGDPARLQQVVWNLVNNAVKFTPKSGQIHVTLARVDSHVEIGVADNGQGIDSALLPRIFDRFQQADSSSTRHHGGLGLGLAIAKQLVELHGGNIRAESDGLGKGAKFVVGLPVPASSQHRSLQSPALKPQQTKIGWNAEAVRLDEVRVLLVDDDNDSREMLSRLLAMSGAVPCESSNVNEALASIRDFNPQVLVSDLGMPGQDGFNLIRQVRSLGHTFQSLPAIALTAFVRPDDRQRALLAGFQVHIAKPVDPRELIAAIATLVGRTGKPR